MKNDYYMKQCVVRKDNVHTTAWLPEEFAHVGKPIQLKQNDSWVRGYQVESVSEVKKPASFMIDYEKGHEKHRGNTDV